MDREPSLFQRRAKARLEGEAKARLDAHRGVIDNVGVPAGCLGLVHGGVGVLEQRVHVLAVTGSDGDADARLHRKQTPGDAEWLGEHLQHALGEVGGLLLALDLVEEDGELVSSHPGQGVARPERRLQTAHDRLKEMVADGVTEAVVDALEAVQVDEHEGQPASRPSRFDEAERQAVVEEHPIADPGERIVLGAVLGGRTGEHLVEQVHGHESGEQGRAQHERGRLQGDPQQELDSQDARDHEGGRHEQGDVRPAGPGGTDRHRLEGGALGWVQHGTGPEACPPQRHGVERNRRGAVDADVEGGADGVGDEQAGEAEQQVAVTGRMLLRHRHEGPRQPQQDEVARGRRHGKDLHAGVPPVGRHHDERQECEPHGDHGDDGGGQCLRGTAGHAPVDEKAQSGHGQDVPTDRQRLRPHGLGGVRGMGEGSQYGPPNHAQQPGGDDPPGHQPGPELHPAVGPEPVHRRHQHQATHQAGGEGRVDPHRQPDRPRQEHDYRKRFHCPSPAPRSQQSLPAPMTKSDDETSTSGQPDFNACPRQPGK